MLCKHTCLHTSLQHILNDKMTLILQCSTEMHRPQWMCLECKIGICANQQLLLSEPHKTDNEMLKQDEY